jgi:hypothetical protein
MASLAEKTTFHAEIEAIEPSRSEVRHHDASDIPLDLDDPHRAAIEDNPEKAETLTWTTLLAVLVRFTLHGTTYSNTSNADETHSLSLSHTCARSRQDSCLSLVS